MRVPSCPLPVVTDAAARLAVAPASGLRITWLGHSTTLIEIDGVRLLTDPIWSQRASPSRWVGPRRYHPPPLALAALPPLDAVLISHEHYDHLDMDTVRALAARGVPFHVPLGIGAHLAAWGVPSAQIVEHDWWQGTVLRDGVRVVSTPARHFNGRGLPWRRGSLWTSWSIVGPRHRVFFSGDTGLTESLREIARREGPFDAALVEIGQYHPTWGNIHLGPVGALDAFARLDARTLIPIHWSTFVLAYHAWSEPAETLMTEAARRGISVATPRLGEPIEPAGPSPTPTTAWWRALPPVARACP
jgi:L-ascorbate metabolism protein UlaG (beta-lactamase superfamily)